MPLGTAGIRPHGERCTSALLAAVTPASSSEPHLMGHLVNNCSLHCSSRRKHARMVVELWTVFILFFLPHFLKEACIMIVIGEKSEKKSL